MSVGAITGDAVRWKLSAFDALTVPQLYALLQLRGEVFVLEQNCAYQDVDGYDARALHLQGYAGDVLLAYARCFGPGIKFAEASIGRIVTRGSSRGTGIGHVLVERAIATITEHYGQQAIRIGAQARLKDFYRGHGFADVGVPYVEDGIAHLEMVWRPQPLANTGQK